MALRFALHARRTALVLVAALALPLVAPGTALAATANDQGAAAVYDATNSFRADNGRAALRRDSGIDRVAQTWAKRMLKQRTMSHNPKYGNQMPQSGLRGWGENVAYACGYGGVIDNVSRIMRAWRASPGHRKNMLNGSYTHIGVGLAYDSASDCAYAVQDFGTYTGTFVDVPANHQFSSHIEWLVREGITTGYADGRFHPGAPVTREAFAAFLYRLAGRPSFTPPKRSPFSDLSTGDQFYKEITWLSAKRITTGYADGTFRPDSDISREAIAAFLYRASGSPAVAMPKSAPFRDVKRNDQFAREIVWLSKKRITTGYANGTFRPHSDVTREATAAFLYRARSIVDL